MEGRSSGKVTVRGDVLYEKVVTWGTESGSEVSSETSHSRGVSSTRTGKRDFLVRMVKNGEETK